MKNLIKLIVASFLLAFSSNAASPYPSDAINKQQAISLATNNMQLNFNKTNKLILLAVCDVNTCTACRSLQYGILPHPKIQNFLKESFVYWGSGPDYNSKDFREYTGNVIVPLPSVYIINPFSAKGVYLYSSSGADAVGTYYAWLSSAYLKATVPVITKTEISNGILNITGNTPSTNVTYRVIKYKINNGAWLSYKSPDLNQFEIKNIKINSGAGNTLYIQGIDRSGTYKSKIAAIKIN